ncbi:protein of unknown function [Flavobacterium resistens]|uniref:DUF4907 domain-containing protein n=1 Tax=Flavobacterium resistens TaxID=443612 RepID=A0A521CNQ2_9FLAO|nr:DUF4907 domain-containing protein [Flavobacterium resistens]MRX66832.1 DUF4907 domain-containing protein [Flavobacterium resistens]SMO61079.1 protein of unknown function [Flavobacterium resistens]
MTINTKKQFFWSKIQKNLLFILLVLQFTACTKKETFKIDSFQTKTGWGYTISNKDKILIKQSIIPAISNTKSFSTEEEALKTAELVVNKLDQNMSPTVTKNDLILLKIKL